jgi:hypothetical protein
LRPYELKTSRIYYWFWQRIAVLLKKLAAMPTPGYCSLMIEIDGIPSFADMDPFQPYFQMQGTKLHVEIRVPNHCYFIAGDEAAAPSGGACGSGSDLQHNIQLNLDPNCSDSSPTTLSIDLNYHEDPSGNPLIIYCEDLNLGAVRKAGKSKSNYVEN